MVNGVLHQGILLFYICESYLFNFLLIDNDDDGETAAGGRIAHLLQILVSLVHVHEARNSFQLLVYIGSE